MDITPLIKGDRKIINSYGAGRFVVSGKEYADSIILSPLALDTWNIDSPFVWNETAIEQLINAAKDAEVVLVGTGKNMLPMPSKSRNLFREKKISLDVMDTGAACRTYNVLLSEERRVIAALIVV
jgi:uncharacterized protein